MTLFYIDPGRNIGNGVVQYLDTDGITWITDDEFIEEIGDVEYSFTEPITTKLSVFRKFHLPHNVKDSSPTRLFEWKVYGTPSCT